MTLNVPLVFTLKLTESMLNTMLNCGHWSLFVMWLPVHFFFFSNDIHRIKLSFVQRTSLASDNMMDNCPIHTHLNIDVAIGLDLARTLPSTRAKNVITENQRLFIHVILTQAISCQSSLKVPALLFLLIFSCNLSLAVYLLSVSSATFFLNSVFLLG